MVRRLIVLALSLTALLQGCSSDHPTSPPPPGPDGLQQIIDQRSVGSLAFSPLGGALALYSGPTLDVYNTNAPVRLFSTTLLDCCGPCGCLFSPSSVCYSHLGRLLAAGPLDDVYVMNASNGAVLDTLEHGHSLSDFRSLAFSPDDRRLYVAGQGDTLSVWDSSTGQAIYRGGFHDPYDCSALALSPDAATLALSGFSRKIALWSTSVRQTMATLDMDSTFTTDMEFSPDGRYLAVSGSYRTVVLWNLATRQPNWVKPGLTSGSAVGVSFSPDGTILATNLTPTDLSLLDVETGALLAQWTTQTDLEILDIQFSRDGRTVAASSHDNVKLWDVATKLALGH